MRISQPSNCEVTTKLLRRLTGQFEVSIALWHLFSIDREQADPDDARILWQLTKSHWPEQPIDEGYPKIRGEFVCFGMAYPPPDLHAGPFEALVRVSNLQRKLGVYGPRVFGTLGSIQEQKPPREPVDIHPKNAFGGKDYPDNPYGVGFNAKGGTPGPSIDDPDDPVLSPTSKVAPAGFWPLSPESSIRKRKLGAFDDNWLKKDWPNFPYDTDLEFFNTAPEQQRLQTYFIGDEEVEIIGMHPRTARMSFKLPGLRARCIYRRSDDESLFRGWHESPIVPETLYLFPNEGLAALLHRTVIQVRRPDALDLHDVLLSLEPISTPSRSENAILKLCQSQLYDVIAPMADDPILVDKTTVQTSATNMKESNNQPQHTSFDAIKRETPAGKIKLSPDFEYILSQTGLDAASAQAIRMAQDPFEALSVAMKKQIQLARDEYNQAVLQSGLSEKEYLEKLKSIPQVDTAMKKADFSAGLRVELEAITDFVDTVVDMLRKASPQSNYLQSANAAKPGDSTNPSQKSNPSHADVTEEMRAFVNARSTDPNQFRGVNISELNFSGLTLAGLDFTGAICEGTDFSDCDLNGACFQDAILTRANFKNAQLSKSIFVDAVAGQAILDGANLTEANLTQTDLSESYCRSTRFDSAILNQTLMDQSNLSIASFKGVLGVKLSACEALIDGCDFSNATLDHADFMKSSIQGCIFNQSQSTRLDLSGAIIKNCSFVSVTFKDCTAMLKASLTNCTFDLSSLQGANWTTISIDQSTFKGCVLSSADFSSSLVTKSQFIQCKAQGMNFFSSTLQDINFFQNHMMDASFHGANIQQSSLAGNNFFGADFIETHFDPETVFEGNVTLKTILAVRGQP